MNKKELFYNIKKASSDYVYLDAWVEISKQENNKYSVDNTDWKMIYLGYDVDDKQLIDDISCLENIKVDQDGCYIASLLFKICRDYDLISEGIMQDWTWYELEYGEYSYQCSLEENDKINKYNAEAFDI